MDYLRRGNKELIKDINRALVIDRIRSGDPISRTEIAQRTKLGLSTITKIIDGLLNQRLVKEVGEGDSSGGRRPIYVDFNYNYGFVVGIKIEKQQVILATTDLRPTVQHKLHLPFTAGASADTVMREIEHGLDQILTGYEERNLACLGIGIGVSGLVDKDAGVLLHSSLLGWDRIEFRAVLQKRYSVPVFVDNDVNVYTLAEICYGFGQELRNFVLVTVGVGVGSGVVQNGQLYRGEYGGAGEFGHYVLVPGGNLCDCGQKGCLETYVNDAFVIAETKRLLSQEKDSVLYDNRRGLSIQDVIDAAAAGDFCARKAVMTAGRNLGFGLLSLVNLLNPAAIILAGEAMVNRDLIIPAVEEILPNNYFARYQPPVKLLVSQLGDDAWEIGAVSMVLNELFQAPIYRNQREARII